MMNDDEITAHLHASWREAGERLAQGICQLDGDSRWDAATEGMAERAIAYADELIKEKKARVGQ